MKEVHENSRTKRSLPVIVVLCVIAAIAVAISFRDRLGASTVLPDAVVSTGNHDAAAPVEASTQQSGSSSQSLGAPRSSGMGGVSPQERMARVQQRREEMRDRTAKANEAGRLKRIAKFNSEAKDAAWSGAAERKLNNVVSADLLATYGVKNADTKVDCRSTVCKITTVLPDPSQADDWTTLYMTNVGTSLPNAYVSKTTLPDGRVSVEVIGIGGRN